MADNYEFALSHIRPEGYIIYIGDDDGLLPNAISDINAVMIETGASVLRWDLPTYWWPTVETFRANQLAIPSLGSGITVTEFGSHDSEYTFFQRYHIPHACH